MEFLWHTEKKSTLYEWDKGDNHYIKNQYKEG